MQQANCFDAPTLKDYLLGKLSDEQSDVVASHLEACLTCEATVSQLDRASDTLTNGLRLPAVSVEPKTDDELQKALDKVQSLEALADHPVSDVSKTSDVSMDRSLVLRDYRLLEPLGSGGMGQVFKAVHTRLDRLVAVKLLPARRLGDEQAVSRFQREMRVIGQLSHPAIVQATDAGEVDGTHFLVMEYVEGCDLNTLAKACGPLSIADACEITRQAALGLEYAHQQGIVHRDIKPSNLMLSRETRVQSREQGGPVVHSQPSTLNSQLSIKILDLGLALLSGEQAPVDELTTVGQLMGTLDYMAPEQLEDSHLVGPRADIYALAATVYRLLTGVAPFAKDDRKTPLQKLRALATQTVTPIRERRADLPDELASIIDRALRRDPAERFASMSEFATALTPWCAGHDLSQLVRQVSNLAGPSIELSGARRGSPDPAAWLDRRSPGASLHTIKAEPHSGDLRSVAAAGSGDPRRASTSPRRTLLITLALFFLAALGIVITVETNKGTLIVESLRDGVEVRVKKSGKMVEQLELSTGPKSARLASGEYEIEIVGEADGLQIQNGKFLLKRGDTVVAKVTEVPKGQVAADKPATATEPTTESQPRKPEIVDRNAKGMETFEASNPDLTGEKNIRDELLKNIGVEFADIPLTDVLKFLEDRTQVTFFLETEALMEEGLATDTSITLSLSDKPTTTVLEFLLRPIHCAWYIEGGQVVVTTASKEKEVFVTRTYPVGKLLPGVKQAVERLRSEPQPGAGQPAQGGGGFFRVSDASAVAGALAATPGQFGGGGAAPAANPSQRQPAIPTDARHFQSLLSESLGYAWLDRDGEGGTCELLHNVLVVRHTRRAQADIEALLRTVEAAFPKPLTEPAEIRPAGYSLAADANVRQQLARRLDVEFRETPLTDAAAWLSDQLGVQVQLDHKALTEGGIATDTPVTLQFQGITGDVLLSRLLKPLQLDYDIEHGLLVITTAAKLQERRVTKVYDVRDLLDRGLHPSRLITGLQTTTPGPWFDQDGDGGTSTLFADTLLVVRQKSHNHAEVAKFLASLRSQLSDQPQVPRVVKATTKPATISEPATAGPSPSAVAEAGPTRGPSTGSAQPVNNGQPRYDGKTFDEWLAVLEVERSPGRLADAFQALRVLRQDQQSALVAERVLKVFRQAEPSASHGDPQNRRLLAGDATDLLGALPAEQVESAAVNELQSGNSRSRSFIISHASSVIRERGKTKPDRLARAILQLSRDRDEVMQAQAAGWLSRLPLEGHAADVIAGTRARLHEALSDKSPETAMLAALGLKDIEAETPAVVATLKRLLTQPENKELRADQITLLGETVKLAALLGPRAAETAPAIAKLLLLRDSETTSHAVLHASMGRAGRSGFTLNFKQTAVLALARMGTSAAETLPVLNELLQQQKSSPPDTFRAFGAFGGGGGSGLSLQSPSVSLTELLIAAKERLEPKPAADPNVKPADPNATPAELKAEDVIAAVARYKLLLAERTLLEQHTPTLESPALRELDQKLTDAEKEATTVLSKYNSQRRTRGGGSPTGFSPSGQFGPTTPPSTKPASQPAAPAKSDE